MQFKSKEQPALPRHNCTPVKNTFLIPHLHKRIKDIPCDAGDTIKRLLWRLKNGELPQKNMPQVAVVLIGTEDIVSPACTNLNMANRTAAELRGLLVYMHRHALAPCPTLILPSL